MWPLKVGDYVAVNRGGTLYGELMEMYGAAPNRTFWVRIGGATSNREIEVPEAVVGHANPKGKDRVNRRANEPDLVYPYTNDAKVKHGAGICAATAMMVCKAALQGLKENATRPDDKAAITIQDGADEAFLAAKAAVKAGSDSAMDASDAYLLKQVGLAQQRKRSDFSISQVAGAPPTLFPGASRQAVRAHFYRYETDKFGHAFALVTTARYMYFFDAEVGLFRFTVDDPRAPKLLGLKLAKKMQGLYASAFGQPATLIEVKLA